MLQGFLVALVSALIYLESRLVGQHMLDRPIIIGPVVGLIMGDPATGLVVGGQLELVWMGLNGIGTTTPPNVVVGSALATALAISTGASYETTLALAVPIAVVAQLCDIAAPIVNTFFAHQADRFADQENYRGIDLCIWGGASSTSCLSSCPFSWATSSAPVLSPASSTRFRPSSRMASTSPATSSPRSASPC